MLGLVGNRALVMKAVGESIEIAHLPYKKKTYEDYLGVYG